MAYVSNPLVDQNVNRLQTESAKKGFLPSSYYFTNGNPMPGAYAGIPAGTQAAGMAPAAASTPDNTKSVGGIPGQLELYPKLQNMQDATQELFSTAAENRKSTGNLLQDYLNEFKASQESTKQQLVSEQAAAADIYNPEGYAKRQEKTLQDYIDSVQGIKQRTQDQVTQKLAGQSVGLSSQGLSSNYLGNLYKGYSDAELVGAKDIASRSMALQEAIKSMQLQAMGKSQALRNNYLASMVQPIDAQNAAQNANINALRGISDTALSNMLYYTPARNTWQIGTNLDRGNGGNYPLVYPDQGGNVTSPSVTQQQRPAQYQPTSFEDRYNWIDQNYDLYGTNENAVSNAPVSWAGNNGGYYNGVSLYPDYTDQAVNSGYTYDGTNPTSATPSPQSQPVNYNNNLYGPTYDSYSLPDIPSYTPGWGRGTSYPIGLGIGDSISNYLFPPSDYKYQRQPLVSPIADLQYQILNPDYSSNLDYSY